MKKYYISPEMELIKYTLVDVLQGSPTDDMNGNEQIVEPELPGGDGLDDL